MRDSSKFCKKSPSFGDIILKNGYSYTPEEYAKLVNPLEIVGFVGSTKKTNAKPGDIYLSTGLIVEKDKLSDISGYMSASGSEPVAIVAIETKNTSDGNLRVIPYNYTPVQAYFGGYKVGEDPEVKPIEGLVSKTKFWNGTEYIDIDNATGSITIPTETCYRPSDVSRYKYCYNTENKTNSLYTETGKLSEAMTYNEEDKNVLYNLNGKENTLLILESLPSTPPETPVYDDLYTCSPATYYCANYEKGDLDWYLPSVGELALVVTNNKTLNFNNTNKHYLSSSLKDESNIYIITENGAGQIKLLDRSKQVIDPTSPNPYIPTVLPMASC